ncbi:PTS sugar transporter subunit IIA [Desulforhabdus amnigena]|jgi:PTS system nitrogen regulatory IIA component|uniref:PTS fructose transporter subunit IIA n=1 Tax=Desulforhabdus amnigena TaxID=40218 RepID=A0A9W6L8Z3_9BACT|nr:PTS sugar transporter subunit IIA [Desulforhabdus amnigena]NLJ29893.1 PTS sugar transporter subunit IIA [Deltaproteobacteria bacterium]GLI36193.1 PTS fructose transporter subunit IIA [Desulforhabdus amnigena]
MKILDILTEKSVITELKGKTKKQVLEELIDAVLEHKPQLDRSRLMAVLLERERLGSTGIGDGIAIPHGKLKDLDQLVLSFGRSTGGVDFESMDGKPVHLFFLLVAPENCAGIHLRALAKIARLLKNSAVRKKLGSVSSREEIYSIIRQEDEDF